MRQRVVTATRGVLGLLTLVALGLADRPAHDLDAREALGRGEREHFIKAEFRENGGDESEFHA